MNIGHRIKSIRTAKGLTWAELADRSGVPANYICALEIEAANNPSREVIEKLAKGFGISVGDLLLIRPEAFERVPERITVYFTEDEFIPYVEAAIEAFKKRIPASTLSTLVQSWTDSE
ncbi:MAG: helix-turn-helix domain-containing protein [Bacillota bacterium]